MVGQIAAAALVLTLTASDSPLHMGSAARAPLLAASMASGGQIAAEQIRAQRLPRPRRAGPQRSARERAAIAIGIAGGLLLGGYIGAKISGDCACDDPGWNGFVIGAPIGAFAGGILAAKLTK